MSTVRFTETMAGHIGVGAPAYDAGEIIGRRDEVWLRFRLTMSCDDVAGLIRDPNHSMRACGSISCPALAAGGIEVPDGTFDVFAPAGADRLTMRYRLPFAIGDRPMTLLGYKDVGNDWGIDMWPDTTTMFVRLVEAAVDGPVDVDGAGSPAEYARGILRLDLPMFLRQLATFRGAGTPRYGVFFFRQLWREYGRGRGPDPLNTNTTMQQAVRHA